MILRALLLCWCIPLAANAASVGQTPPALTGMDLQSGQAVDLAALHLIDADPQCAAGPRPPILGILLVPTAGGLNDRVGSTPLSERLPAHVPSDCFAGGGAAVDTDHKAR